MSSLGKRKQIVDCSSWGEPAKVPNGVETLRFIVYDFDCDMGKPFGVHSNVMRAHGYWWKIELKPQNDSISFRLNLCTRDIVDRFTAECTFRWRNIRITQKLEFANSSESWILNNLCKREDAKDRIAVFEVDIQIISNVKCLWYPEQQQQQDFLRHLYHDDLDNPVNVVFSVGKATFRAHRNVLSRYAKKLYDVVVETSDTDRDKNPIQIPSIRGEVFKSLLELVYTINYPKLDREDVAIETLVAADRFELVHLKLYTESILVDKFLKASNAAAMLVVADSYSCALLKEAATNLFLFETETVQNSEGWAQIKESPKLLEALLNASIARSHKLETGIHPSENSSMDEIEKIADTNNVTWLREALEEYDIAVDGSQEVLKKRFIEYFTAHPDELFYIRNY